MSEKKDIMSSTHGIRVSGNVVEIDFSIYFSSPDAIPAQLFADGVIGTMRMVKESRVALLSLLGIENLKAQCEVCVDKVVPGSKFEEFVFRAFLGSDEEAAATADKLHQRIGVNRMLEGKHMQNVALALIAAYTINGAVAKYVDATKRTPMIQATDSIVLNAGRDLNLEDGRVRELLETGIRDKVAAGKGAVMAIGPARYRADTSVRFGGPEGVEIPREVLEALPDPDDIKTEKQRTESDYSNVEVSFVAGDRDKRSNGWAVIMPPDMPGAGRRLPAEIAETLSPLDLMYRKTANVDITIFFAKDGRASRVLIRALSQNRTSTHARMANPSE